MGASMRPSASKLPSGRVTATNGVWASKPCGARALDGLAQVHFAEGNGGLDVRPELQRIVETQLISAPHLKSVLVPNLWRKKMQQLSGLSATLVVACSSRSIKAFRTEGFDAAMASPILPLSPSGIPFVSSSHVAPPLVVLKIPLPGPPPLKPHARRRRW